MIEMSVEFVRVSMQNYNRVVILKEKESERYLLIWIGPAEAEAIAMRLGDVSAAAAPDPRPAAQHHRLAGRAGVATSWSTTSTTTPSTPASSSRATAARSRSTRAPATRSRWRCGPRCRSTPRSRCWSAPASCWTRSRRQRAGRRAGSMGEPRSRVGPEELEKMSAFKDFIESLDLDDFEKRKT